LVPVDVQFQFKTGGGIEAFGQIGELVVLKFFQCAAFCKAHGIGGVEVC
jgi:hypothetical protein